MSFVRTSLPSSTSAPQRPGDGITEAAARLVATGGLIVLAMVTAGAVPWLAAGLLAVSVGALVGRGNGAGAWHALGTVLLAGGTLWVVGCALLLVFYAIFIAVMSGGLRSG